MKSIADTKARNIRIDKIRVLNPRERDKKKHQQLIDSIASVGLKCPIRVSRRSESDEDGFDLVFGQGRLEAFQALGAREIPAMIVDVPKEDRLLMSLVENFARRYPNPVALVREIERLKGLGYSNVQIGKKIGVSDTVVGGLAVLSRSGEERLLKATLLGKISMSVAIDIAKTESVQAQRELLKAYETKKLGATSLRVVKSLIEKRQLYGKGTGEGGDSSNRKKPSADALVVAYRSEMDRRKNLTQKADAAEKRLLFVVTALKKLLSNENYVNLLRAERLDSLPEYLAIQLKQNRRHESAAA